MFYSRIPYHFFFFFIFSFISNGLRGQSGSLDIKSSTGVYDYSYNAIPASLTSSFSGSLPLATYAWEKSDAPLSGFVIVPGATGSSFSRLVPSQISAVSNN
jgi:hypothetical protein